jgi:hypothetical protein
MRRRSRVVSFDLRRPGIAGNRKPLGEHEESVPLKLSLPDLFLKLHVLLTQLLSLDILVKFGERR